MAGNTLMICSIISISKHIYMVLFRVLGAEEDAKQRKTTRTEIVERKKWEEKSEKILAVEIFCVFWGGDVERPK